MKIVTDDAELIIFEAAPLVTPKTLNVNVPSPEDSNNLCTNPKMCVQTQKRAQRDFWTQNSLLGLWAQKGIMKIAASQNKGLQGLIIFHDNNDLSESFWGCIGVDSYSPK